MKEGGRKVSQVESKGISGGKSRSFSFSITNQCGNRLQDEGGWSARAERARNIIVQ